MPSEFRNVAGHQATCSHGQMVDGWLLYAIVKKSSDSPVANP